MQGESLQNGAISTDPNKTVQEGQDLGVQDGPRDGDAETVTEEDTKEAVSAE